MKTFYSCIDVTLTSPQPVQHLVIRDCAAKAGGSIVFYGAEELRTKKSQSFIRAKLARTPGLDGVVFFTLHQFRYGSKLNLPLMLEILDAGKEIHFAREGISYRNRKELEDNYTFLYSVDFTMRRDESAEWKKLIQEIDLPGT